MRAGCTPLLAYVTTYPIIQFGGLDKEGYLVSQNKVTNYSLDGCPGKSGCNEENRRALFLGNTHLQHSMSKILRQGE